MTKQAVGTVGGDTARAMRRLAKVSERQRQSTPVIVRPARPGDRRDGVVSRFATGDPDGRWFAEAGCRRSPEGGLVIQQLVLEAGDASAGVTSALLREVPVGRFLDGIRLLVEEQLLREDLTRRLLGEEPVSSGYAKPDQEQPPRRNGGRPPLSDDLLRDVAVRYLELVDAGNAPVLATLADHYDRPVQTVRDWVRASRKAEWLGPGRRGVAAATMGRRLLEDMDAAAGTTSSRVKKGGKR